MNISLLDLITKPLLVSDVDSVGVGIVDGNTPQPTAILVSAASVSAQNLALRVRPVSDKRSPLNGLCIHRDVATQANEKGQR